MFMGHRPLVRATEEPFPKDNNKEGSPIYRHSLAVQRRFMLSHFLGTLPSRTDGRAPNLLRPSIVSSGA
jgi:hypothetical protein